MEDSPDLTFNVKFTSIGKMINQEEYVFKNPSYPKNEKSSSKGEALGNKSSPAAYLPRKKPKKDAIIHPALTCPLYHLGDIFV